MRNGYCITSEESADNFVGIRFREGVPEVVFPHGFALSTDEKECRKDVFRLLAVLKRFTDHADGTTGTARKNILSQLPITSYQYIIQDFLLHGYYRETEIRHIQSVKGKINWKRTIQQEEAHLDDDNVVYLNFRVKTNQIKEDNLITQIHKYCVYQSFYRFGWLYLSTSYLPPNPSVRVNKRQFINCLTQALNNTFNDSKRKLFQCMINIIQDNTEEMDLKNFSFGVNRFDGVWERLVDYVFGESDKNKYFPHATWHIIKNGKIAQSSALEPDTIMKYHGKIYVLDAKYYQYGITDHPGDLPNTSSIQKQITYGKHIAEQMHEVDKRNVYNAFIMPFNSNGGNTAKFVSVGTADWELYTPQTLNYAYVLGILLDTKWLLTEYTKHNAFEIEKMANLIEYSLSNYRATTEKPDFLH